MSLWGSQHKNHSSFGRDLQPRFLIEDGSVMMRSFCCSVRLRLEPKSRFICFHNHLSHLKTSEWISFRTHNIFTSKICIFYNLWRKNLSNSQHFRNVVSELQIHSTEMKITPLQTVQFIQDLNKFLNRPNKLVSVCSCASCSFCCLCSSFIFFLSASFFAIASFFSWYVSYLPVNL